MTTLLLAVAAAAAAETAEAEQWPGVKVTYYKGADFDKQVLVTYEREMRHDLWVPLPLTGEGRRRTVGPFSIRWEANLRIDRTGQYVFRPSTTARTGFDLHLAGRPVPWDTREIEVVAHGTKRTKRIPVSKPVALRPGRVPVRMEVRSKGGRLGRDALELLWRGPGIAEQVLSPARASVAPWPGMKRRPMLRYAMVGHSNVQGRVGGTVRGEPTTVGRACYYDSGRRVWRPLTVTNFNHTSALTTALSEKYPGVFFGGMMMGQGASNVCDQWGRKQMFYLQTLRALRNTAHCGPLVAMGSHFDWDEMKKKELVDAFERAHADLIRAFRQDLTMPRLPWLFTRVSPCFRSWNAQWYSVLHRAADNVARDLPFVQVVTCDDFKNQGTVPKGQADTGPEGPMHYTKLGFRKWAARALPLLEDMEAVEKALAELHRPARPYPEAVEVDQGWPISNDPDEPILCAYVVVKRVSKARDPMDLAPYRDALMTVEYEVVRSAPAYKPKRLVALHRSVIDLKTQPITRVRPGEKFTLALASWAPQPVSVTQLPLDDSIAETELPWWLVLGAYPGHRHKSFVVLGKHRKAAVAGGRGRDR